MPHSELVITPGGAVVFSDTPCIWKNRVYPMDVTDYNSSYNAGIANTASLAVTLFLKEDIDE